MNKNIIPSLDDTFKLTEQEFIIKYNGCKFDSEAEAKIYRRLYDITNNDDSFKAVYDYKFPSKSQSSPAQVDFLLLKHGVGAALIEVKGKYEDLEGAWKQAHNQLKAANYSLHDRIKVYNIIIFPDSNLEKEKFFQNNKNDVNGYIVDKNTFDEWVDKNKCIEYFNNFFDEERYKNHNPKTNETEETEEELFNFNKYYNQYLLDRDRKEEERINNLCDNIESIEENSNIIMLSGLAGSGKTFVAMNVAIKKTNNVLFIVRNQSLFEQIEEYFNKHIGLPKEQWCIPRTGYEKRTKTIYDTNNKILTLIKLDMKIYGESKKEFVDLINNHQVLIIDEIQDATSNEIGLLINETANNDKQLFLVGDYNQFTNISNKDEFEKIKTIIENMKENKQIQIIDYKNKNFRNSIEIKNFIYKILNENNNYEDKIFKIKIFFHYMNNKCFNPLLKNEFQTIQETPYSAIIYLYYHDKWTLKALNNIGIKKHEIIKSYNFSKGCEYNKVIVVGCSKNQLLFLEDDWENTISRQQLSLAAGRAKEELTLVFYVENDDEKQEIKYILEKDYKFDESCFI